MFRRNVSLLGRVLKERPFYILKYGSDTLGFCVNYLLLHWQSQMQSNLVIGKNPRVLTLNVFKAEMPNAHIRIGDHVVVYRNCDILATGDGHITIGDRCLLGSGFRLYCKHSVSIGNSVVISWNVFITDYDAHPIDPDDRYQQIYHIHRNFFPSFSTVPSLESPQEYKSAFVTRSVIIGDNVWIGANATILKGVHIGSGSIIGTGAVVTKDVPERTIVAGNPAVIVRTID